MTNYREEKDRKQRDRDEKYLVHDPIKGRVVFDSKRAWYDALAKCSKSQIKEVNRALKDIGMTQTAFRVNYNEMYESYYEKRLDPNYGPSIWTIAGMLSGSPPTSEDIRNQIGLVRRQRFQEKMNERHQATEG